MTERLLVCGSNSGFQLGLGHKDDVRTLQAAQCQVDASGSDGQQEITGFPPAGFGVDVVASGANHSLAVIRRQGVNIPFDQRTEVWVCGTGRQGQLGPAYAVDGSSQPKVFTRLDMRECLNSLPEEDRAAFSARTFQVKDLACGWHCSYIVLAVRDEKEPDRPLKDELISLGLHRENKFGELGCRPPEGASRDESDRCVHRISFRRMLRRAQLNEDEPWRIVSIAAGLRHTVVVYRSEMDDDSAQVVVAGWGSTRHGQVGEPSVPTAPPDQPNQKRHPYKQKIVWDPQSIWSTFQTSNTFVTCSLALGRDHSILLVTQESFDDKSRRTDTICVGSNNQGQLVDAPAVSPHGAEGEDIVKLSCNWTSTLVLVEALDSRVYQDKRLRRLVLACGSNSKGQLGDGTRNSIAGDYNLKAVDLDTILNHRSSGTAAEAGSDGSNVTRELTVIKMMSGSEHTLVLVARKLEGNPSSTKFDITKEVWGWGWNEHGNLAQGEHDEADRDRPVLIVDGSRSGAAHGLSPTSIWAAYGTSFILVKAGVDAIST